MRKVCTPNLHPPWVGVKLLQDSFYATSSYPNSHSREQPPSPSSLSRLPHFLVLLYVKIYGHTSSLVENPISARQVLSQHLPVRLGLARVGFHPVPLFPSDTFFYPSLPPRWMSRMSGRILLLLGSLLLSLLISLLLLLSILMRAILFLYLSDPLFPASIVLECGLIPPSAHVVHFFLIYLKRHPPFCSRTNFLVGPAPPLLRIAVELLLWVAVKLILVFLLASSRCRKDKLLWLEKPLLELYRYSVLGCYPSRWEGQSIPPQLRFQLLVFHQTIKLVVQVLQKGNEVTWFSSAKLGYFLDQHVLLDETLNRNHFFRGELPITPLSTSPCTYQVYPREGWARQSEARTFLSG